MSRPEIRLVPVGSLRTDPRNPRVASKVMFQRLKKAMEEDPDFLWMRPILALADGTVYGGNLRLRAAIDLGRDVVPAVVEDISLKLARERQMRDNLQFGNWDADVLPEFLVEMVADGVDLSLLGFEDKELERIMATAGIDGGDGSQPEPAKVVCPECGASFVPVGRSR